MHWSLLIATCLVALGSAASDSPRLILGDMKLKIHSSKHLEEEWQNFKINHNKAYNDAKEEIFRKKIFAEHLEAIEAHNRLYSEGLTTFTMGINQFADLESSEFVKRMNGYRPRNASEEPPSASFFEPEIEVSSLPKEVDWRLKGYVTPVKNQTPYCGSCWAFSAIGALEGQHFRKKGKLVSLSEQQLIDCSKEDNGCCGGWPYRALSYIALNGGIDTEESYPYENKNGPCRYNQSNVGATCNDYAYIRKTEWALQVAVAAVGPISVAIEVLPSLQFYNGGVYDDPTCSGAKLNHAVLVVGYGKTAAGKKYWIVKNSWGPKWGKDGYIWMSKNKKNQCGITNVAVYPIV